MRNKFAFLFLVINPVILLMGQDSVAPVVPDKELLLGTGWSKYKLKDDAFTSLMYAGNTWFAGLDYNERKDRYLDFLQLTCRTGILGPAEAETSLRLYRVDLDWIHIRKLNNSMSRSDIYLGGHFVNAFETAIHTEWPNNSFNYHFSQSVGPSFGYSYANEQHNFIFDGVVSVPFLAYVVRPSISNILPLNTARRDASGPLALYLGGKFETINHYQRVQSRLAGSFLIAGRFWGRILYSWDLMSYRVDNFTGTASHSFLFSLMYGFGEK